MDLSPADVKTADLCDRHPDEVWVAEPLLRPFGGRRAAGGPLTTLRVADDNLLVRQTLEGPGAGRVLVVDGGGSLRCALLGDRLAALAAGNGWAAVVIHGCVRDTAELSGIELGVWALAAHPARSAKRGRGQREVTVSFAGVSFRPGDFLYADQDGLLVARRSLLP